jgi:hypothetical protein
MGKMSRTKGQSGEREVAHLIFDLLGIEVHRNWQEQSAQGGSDLYGLGGFSVEVKRYKEVTPSLIKGWWEQTVGQANNNEIPVLFYRGDRQPWRVVMDGSWVMVAEYSMPMENEDNQLTQNVFTPDWLFEYEFSITMTPELFATLARGEIEWDQQKSLQH